MTPHCINRRNFLRTAGLAGAGLVVQSCQGQKPRPAAVQPAAGPATVSISRAKDYDPKTVRAALEQMFDQIGGLGDVVRPGARVVIKINLTGGAYWSKFKGIPSTEVFQTHPATVQALCELLRDQGAGKITVVESLDNNSDWPVWDIPAAVKATGAALIDLGVHQPYKDWATIRPGTSPLIYESFTMNPILGEVDTFISLAKMKLHWTVGVTGAVKNLVGTTPLALYRQKVDDPNRTKIHGTMEKGFDDRLVRVIMDLNHARPVHLGILDGIMTSEGGEGPWLNHFGQIKPGVMLAGKDPLAVDAVSAAVMGYDPEAEDMKAPFIRSENYLRLAEEQGIGTHRLSQIKVVGETIDAVRMPFRAAE